MLVFSQQSFSVCYAVLMEDNNGKTVVNDYNPALFRFYRCPLYVLQSTFYVVGSALHIYVYYRILPLRISYYLLSFSRTRIFVAELNER